MNKIFKTIPCARCGDCCKEEVCPMGEKVYKTKSFPCPGLMFDKGESSCELIKLMKPLEFAFMSFVMGIGKGCTNETKLPFNLE